MTTTLAPAPAWTREMSDVQPGRACSLFLAPARKAGWSIGAQVVQGPDELVLILRAVVLDEQAFNGRQVVEAQYRRGEDGKDSLRGYWLIYDRCDGSRPGWATADQATVRTMLAEAPGAPGYVLPQHPSTVARAKYAEAASKRAARLPATARVPKPRVLGEARCPICRRVIKLFGHEGHAVWSSHNDSSSSCPTTGRLLCKIPARGSGLAGVLRCPCGR